VISDGATQWMTAGGGILHIETPPEALVRSGGLFHGLQLWVNLPAADKLATPRYQSLEGDQATLLSSADGGALVRIIAGDIGGHTGPGATHTPITFLHATVAPGARLHLPWRAGFNALAYVLSGSGQAGSEGRPVGEGDLVVFGGGDHLLLGADALQGSASPNLEVVVLGGRPIREPLAWYGPFVMNTRAEVLQAVEDYQAGRLGAVPIDGLQPYRG
jgi:redox-sensitive bicupin YhaK (pirin superfamily)